MSTVSSPESRGARRSDAVYSVLVIDDDPLVRRILARIFGERGHRVVAAESAREGLATALSARFDVVLSDQQLGDGEGSALLDHLEERLTAEARPLPAMILMSGDAGEWTRPFVPKPFALERLWRTFHAEVEKVQG